MKFLRLAFYVLIAQLVLSGCAGEAVEETSSSSSSEINFDAYVNRNASTRAGVTDIKFLKLGKGTWNSGFGVFARYNHTDGTISSLMDTEWVTWNKDQNPNHWEYTNTRYWPNEGFVDFYAFAPYNGGVKMGKLPDYLAQVNKPDSKDETYIWFPSNWNPVDLLWANAFDQTKENNSGAKKVEFIFNHATARLGFDITANQTDEVITVNNMKLYCVSNNERKGVFDMEGYLNLKTGNWYVVNNEDTRWYYTWTPTGNDGEGPDVGKGPELKLDGDKLSNPNDIIKNSPHSYIFIIPQEIPHQKKKEDFYLEITYTVGNSTNPVTVKKNLLDVLRPGDPNPSFTFERGKAYDFHLKLSPNSSHSRVTTNVKNWDVDVVNNVPCNQIGRKFPIRPEPTATGRRER